MVMWWAPWIQMLLSYLRHLTERNAFYFLKTLSRNRDLLCMGEQFKLPRLAKCLRSIIIAYSNNTVIFAPDISFSFSTVFFRIAFWNISSCSPADCMKTLSLSLRRTPWAMPRPENSVTLCRHRTTPVCRGRLNLQNTSAGARRLLWSAANLSCLPPLWSCLNKNESGWSWRHKELLDAAARLPSSAVCRGPAPMVAIWPR